MPSYTVRPVNHEWKIRQLAGEFLWVEERLGDLKGNRDSFVSDLGEFRFGNWLM